MSCPQVNFREILPSWSVNYCVRFGLDVIQFELYFIVTIVVFGWVIGLGLVKFNANIKAAYGLMPNEYQSIYQNVIYIMTQQHLIGVYHRRC